MPIAWDAAQTPLRQPPKASSCLRPLSAFPRTGPLLGMQNQKQVGMAVVQKVLCCAAEPIVLAQCLMALLGRMHILVGAAAVSPKAVARCNLNSDLSSNAGPCRPTRPLTQSLMVLISWQPLWGHSLIC